MHGFVAYGMWHVVTNTHPLETYFHMRGVTSGFAECSLALAERRMASVEKSGRGQPAKVSRLLSFHSSTAVYEASLAFGPDSACLLSVIRFSAVPLLLFLSDSLPLHSSDHVWSSRHWLIYFVPLSPWCGCIPFPISNKSSCFQQPLQQLVFRNVQGMDSRFFGQKSALKWILMSFWS
jgi:hypothetical protein